MKSKYRKLLLARETTKTQLTRPTWNVNGESVRAILLVTGDYWELGWKARFAAAPTALNDVRASMSEMAEHVFAVFSPRIVESEDI